MTDKKEDGKPVWVSEGTKSVLADFRELTGCGLSSEEALKILELAYRNENHSRLCNYFPEVFWHEFNGALRALSSSDLPTVAVKVEPA